MTQQPEALRLADAMQELDGLFSRTGACGEAAAELRRLHEVNAELVSALNEAVMLIGDWGAYASEYFQAKYDLEGDIDRINAVIAKATGEQP